MIDKFLGSRRLWKILGVLVAATFLVAALSFGYPALKRANLIDSLGTLNLESARTLARSISYLEGDSVAALASAPSPGTNYKRLSGLLSSIKEQNRLVRVYALGRSGTKTVYLLDSDYRDNAKPDSDYFLPGSSYEGTVADFAASSVNSLFDKNTRATFVKSVIKKESYGENVVVALAPITDSYGNTVAVLAIEAPAGNADFSRLGAINFSVLFKISAAAFAVLVLLTLILANLRKRRAQKAQKEKENKILKELETEKAKNKLLQIKAEGEEKKAAALSPEPPEVPPETEPQSKPEESDVE